MSKRDPYWDIVKGFLILMVILGHSIFVAKGLDDPFHVFIYSFHMPLFIIISGFFFSQSLHHPIKYIVWKRFFQLVVPVLLIGTIDWVIGYLDFHLSFKENLINWFARTIRTLWFLQALFLCSMIVLFGERLMHRHSWILYVALFVLSLITPDYLEQSGTKAMFPFFVIGCYLHKRKQDFFPFVRKNEGLFLIGSIILFAILLIPFRFSMTFYQSGVYIFNPAFSPITLLCYNGYRLLIGCVGSATILLLIKYLCRVPRNSSPRTLLSVLGKNTLWLYITSVYFWIGYLKWFSNTTPSTYWAALLIFLGLLFLSFPLSLFLNNLWSYLEKKLRPQSIN